MASFSALARLLCFLLACALLVLTAGQIQQFVASHHWVALSASLALLLALPAGLLTLAAGFLMEASLLGWSRSSLRALSNANASVRLDALCATMALLPYRLPAYLLSFGLIYLIEKHWITPAHVSLTAYLPSWGMQVAALLLLTSFVSYWIHRLEHSIPALWALHKFHHSADHLSIFTAVRQTELAKGLEQLVLFIFLALLSEPMAAKPDAGTAWFALVIVYALYRTFIRVNQYLVHSNLVTDYGWIGRWLLVSPRMHRLHHATDARFYNKNFTFDLVLWDRLFGSYASCDETTARALSLGLDDTPFNSGGSLRCVLKDYFLTPYLVFWRELRRGVRAWQPYRLAAAQEKANSPSTAA